MSTATSVISQDQLQKWADAIQEFANEIFAKYPTLDGTFIPTLVDELKAIGLAKQYISKRSLWAAFRNCVGDNRIKLPKEELVLTQEVVDKLRNSFPPVIKKVERELTQREKNSLSGVERNTGRKNHAHPDPDDNQAAEKNFRANIRLNTEYRNALAEAEMLTGRTHAESFYLRKEAVAKVKADPRFKSIAK